MTLKYTVACGVVFAIFIFLKFVEDSPVRSWKAALITATGLSVIVCFYLHWAFPKPLPPKPLAKKLSDYRETLERNFSHIAGVDQVSVQGSAVRINFGVEKSDAELKRVAEEAGWNAVYLLKNGKQFQLTIIMSVRGEDRYKAVLDSDHGTMHEQALP